MPLPSPDYELWTDPSTCLDPCCIIDGQGDPTPESGEGAIPGQSDENGHMDQW